MQLCIKSSAIAFLLFDLTAWKHSHLLLVVTGFYLGCETQDLVKTQGVDLHLMEIGPNPMKSMEVQQLKTSKESGLQH